MISLIFKFLLFVGMFSLFFCKNWLFLWVWMECITLCIIVLLRALSKNLRNLESTSKYFVTQALASVIFLVGMLSRFYFDSTLSLSGKYSYLSYGLITAGLLMKLGVFPNPYWFVDVVSGASYSRLAYVVVFSKVGPLYLLYIMADYSTFLVTGFMGLITALVFSLMGINQPNLRKLIAFSSVANLGWFMLCLPMMSGSMVMFCFLGYVFSMMPLIWVSNYLKLNKLLKVGRLYYNNFQKLAMLLSLLSLGGLPPFVGFFIKWLFFQGLADKGLYPLSSLLVASSLLSLFFYLYSSFNIYSLFSSNIKSQVIFFHCSQDTSWSLFISFALILVVSLLGFLGLVFILKVS